MILRYFNLLLHISLIFKCLHQISENVQSANACWFNTTVIAWCVRMYRLKPYKTFRWKCYSFKGYLPTFVHGCESGLNSIFTYWTNMFIFSFLLLAVAVSGDTMYVILVIVICCYMYNVFMHDTCR